MILWMVEIARYCKYDIVNYCVMVWSFRKKKYDGPDDRKIRIAMTWLIDEKVIWFSIFFSVLIILASNIINLSKLLSVLVD